MERLQDDQMLTQMEELQDDLALVQQEEMKENQQAFVPQEDLLDDQVPTQVERSYKMTRC